MKANEFGSFIRKLRNEKEMTIRQLELYSGVSNSYLSQLENGKRGIPSPDIIKKLSKGLKVDYNELMIQAGYMDRDNQFSETYDPEFIKFMDEVKVWYKNEPKTKEEKLRIMRKMFEVFKED